MNQVFASSFGSVERQFFNLLREGREKDENVLRKSRLEAKSEILAEHDSNLIQIKVYRNCRYIFVDLSMLSLTHFVYLQHVSYL